MLLRVLEPLNKSTFSVSNIRQSCVFLQQETKVVSISLGTNINNNMSNEGDLAPSMMGQGMIRGHGHFLVY